MGSKVLGGEITPLHIEIALHYLDLQDSGSVAYAVRDSAAADQVHHEFADAGLLEFADDGKHWRATDGMRLYIESLCRVPLPVKQAGMPPDMVSHLDSILNKGNGSPGEDTINTKIAAVMDEYAAIAQQARF